MESDYYKRFIRCFFTKIWRCPYSANCFFCKFWRIFWIYKDEEALNNIKNSVGEFSQISVREEDMVSLCDDLFNLKVDKTLDPTLLGTDFGTNRPHCR